MIKIKLKNINWTSVFYIAREEKLEGEFSEALLDAGAHQGEIQLFAEVARLGRGEILLPQPVQKVFVVALADIVRRITQELNPDLVAVGQPSRLLLIFVLIPLEDDGRSIGDASPHRLLPRGRWWGVVEEASLHLDQFGQRSLRRLLLLGSGRRLRQRWNVHVGCAVVTTIDGNMSCHTLCTALLTSHWPMA